MKEISGHLAVVVKRGIGIPLSPTIWVKLKKQLRKNRKILENRQLFIE
jgi:hypothetical protein